MNVLIALIFACVILFVIFYLYKDVTYPAALKPLVIVVEPKDKD